MTPLGGGAGAAETVAIAARIAHTVATRSGGLPGLAAQAAALERRACALAEANAVAFAAALESLRSDDHPGLGLRMTAAAEVPGRIAEAAADVAELALALSREGSEDLRPDAVIAATLAEAAAAAAAHLVAVNLVVGEGDPRAAAARAAADAARAAREAALVR